MIFEQQGVKYSQGTALPFGPSVVEGNAVNFSINSVHATSCTLVLFHKGAKEPYAEIELPASFRKGNNFAIKVYDLDLKQLEYGFRFDGPYDKTRGLLFDKTKILMDPYSYGVAGHDTWAKMDYASSSYPLRSYIPISDFDWEGDKPLNRPLEDCVIYETHVRSFSMDPFSTTENPGTYQAIAESSDYLKYLGVNCIELLPIYDFNEREFDFRNDSNILNLWGYSPISFFAPKASYAAIKSQGVSQGVQEQELPTSQDQFKAMVKALHKDGIEVILDVVYNHTAEFTPKDNGQPLIYNFRGIDNPTYYMLQEDGTDQNFSGCFNTFNCNNPIASQLILDSLRYWVTEYHIDGFRFDLASVLSRGEDGEPVKGPQLLDAIAQDPVLANTKLIAEAWDAAGLYQMGSFPGPSKWSEWNDRYRNTLRSFLLGDANAGQDLVKRIEGSPDIFHAKDAAASINFVTCHDGFTLADLYAYKSKHNLANGEKNKDGSDWNISDNCGIEGETMNTTILKLRKQCVKNALTILLMSRGVPMLLAGDEIGNSQSGNNNAYCQDNPIGWINWARARYNTDLFGLVHRLLTIRKEHPVLRSRSFSHRPTKYGFPELSFHGIHINDIHLDSPMLTFAALYVETTEHYKVEEDCFIYVGMNQYQETQPMELPQLPDGFVWRKYIDTSDNNHREKPLITESHYILAPRSTAVIIGRKE